jgi:hypothetical protein
LLPIVDPQIAAFRFLGRRLIVPKEMMIIAVDGCQCYFLERTSQGSNQNISVYICNDRSSFLDCIMQSPRSSQCWTLLSYTEKTTRLRLLYLSVVQTPVTNLTSTALLGGLHLCLLHINHCTQVSKKRRKEKRKTIKKNHRESKRDVLWLAATADESDPSIPGSACAILLNRFFTLWPSFALVSTNIRLFFLASSSPCCVVTSRLSFRSVLFPTRTMITSLPRSARTSSIHFLVFWNDFASAQC